MGAKPLRRARRNPSGHAYGRFGRLRRQVIRDTLELVRAPDDHHIGAAGFSLAELALSLAAKAKERIRANGTARDTHTLLPDGTAVRTDVTDRRRNEEALRAARDAAEAGSRARSGT